MALTADQLNTIYQNVLFRNVDAGGIQFFANRSDISDAQVRQQIELSQEASTFVSPVVRLYQEVLGRVPDVAGLKFFSTQLRAGQSLDNIAQQLINSSEFQAKTTATSGSVDVTDLSNTNQLVSDAFQSILGRSPSSGEFQFFTGKSAAQILSAVAGSSEAANTNAANVVTFLDSAAVGSPNSGTLNGQVNSNGTSGGGSLFTLTTGADNIAGTAGNDIINGIVSVTAGSATDTLNPTDVISGGSGFDILNITATGIDTTPLNGAQVTNIEAIQIRATGGAVSLNAALAPSAKFLNSNVSSGAANTVTFTGAAAGVVFGDIGDGVNTTSAFTGQYANTVTAGALTLANGVKGGAVTVNSTALTSLAITSTGNTNTIASLTTDNTVKSVTINAVTNLDLGAGISTLAAGATETISGAATSVKLGTVGNEVASINASGLTAGGVTAALGTGVASTFTFTGGQGSDTVSIGGNFTTAPAAGSINGGNGTDVINLTGAVSAAATASAFTGFETLRNTVAATQDASLFGTGITTVQTNLSGAGFSNLTAAQAASIQILKTTAGSTFTLANANGTTDVLGLNLLNDSTINSGVTASTVISATGLKVAGFETVNVAAASGGTSIYQADGTTPQATGAIDTVSFSATAGDTANLKAIALSGAFSAIVDATNVVTLTSFDASANTAGVNFTSGAVTGQLAITGSGAADIVNVGTPANGGTIGAISLGAGNDILKIAQAAISSTTTIDGGAGTDTLELTDTGGLITIADASFRGVTNVEKIVLDATQLSFTTGGFANSLATANGGTLDVTAANVGNNGATINASGLTGTNKLALNLTSTGTDVITTSTGGADSITIKGVHTGAITVNGGNNTAGLNIDASGASSATASTFTTGSGNDTIKLGAILATINTGTGSDNVTLQAADAVVQSFTLTGNGVASTSNALNVTNFGITAANSDTLNFATTGVLDSTGIGNGFSVTNGVATKAGASLADFVSAVANSTTAGSAAFVVGSDTYVAYSNGASGVTGADHLVHLIGVTATAVGTTAVDGQVHLV